MRILLYSDYPALLEALQQESKRYSGVELLQAHPDTELLTLPDFQFMLLAPLAATSEAGATLCDASQLDVWQEKVAALVELCSLRQAQLVLISSDMVFAADQLAISEFDSPTNPSQLAKSLIILEEKIAQLPQSIILRTPPSLSSTPEGGLAKLVANCLANEPPKKINYRGLQPLDDLARVLLGIILQINAGAKVWGLYHYAGSEPVSQSELFTTLMRHLKTTPDTLTNAPIKTPSTNKQSMSSQHLLETFGVHPRAWREKLPELLELLNESA